MPSASSEGKELKPTPKKLEKAKKDGNLPRAKEFSTLTSFVLIIIFMWMFADDGIVTLSGQVQIYLETLSVTPINSNSAAELFGDMVIFFIMLMTPLFTFLVIIGIFLSLFLQGGWQVSMKPFEFKPSKMNPVKGIKKIFGSKDALKELVRSVLLIIIIGSFTVVTLTGLHPQLALLHLMPLRDSLAFIFAFLFSALLKLSLFFIILAIIDLAWTKYNYTDKMKMNQQEMKDERKTTDGDPQVKRRIRTIQFQQHRQRMMSEVPNADVIITNPVHLAVAISYSNNKAAAPAVVAKGQGVIAEKMKEIALANDVPIVENPPLARTLFKAVEVGDFVPADLYKAIAEVLAYVYKLKGKMPA
jgi:flagellar biosynthetic protein FlhB